MSNNMNTRKFFDSYIVDNLSVKFYFLVFIIRIMNNVTLARIHFHIVI